MRRPWLWLGLVLILAAATWGGARAFAAYRLRSELDQAEREMEARLFEAARRRLTRLQARWPGQAEVEYQLGLCQRARGDLDAALRAWARVPAGSPLSARAAVLRADELINTGRYAPAEAALRAALPEAGADTFELQRTLTRLYRFEGRTADVRRLLRSTWAQSPDPAGVLKELWLLDFTPIPAEALQLALEKADQQDDRVMLGRANLARLTGRFDESARWLTACLERRPDDPAVWRGRLELARSSGDIAGLWDALEHLPARALTEAETLELRAWMAARRGDRAAEHQSLTDLLALEPGNLPALERLAALAAESGKADEAARLNRRKATLDDAKDRYRKLLLDGDRLEARASELARLSQVLGRRFDARAWTLIPQRRPGSRLPNPDDSPRTRTAQPRGTLADRLVDLRPAATSKANRPAASAGATRPVFTDDASKSGLVFTFDNGKTEFQQLPETMSGGVGLLDFDGDGWLDVYVVQGGPLDPEEDVPNGDRLFRNQGDGTFRDVTASSEIAAFPRDYGLGVAVGDIDNDGDPDLFISRLKSYALYRNRGDGTFEDATEAAGLAGRRDNPTSAAFADLDNDGDLDLYVCHYMIWDPEHPTLCRNDRGGYFYCDPSKVPPARDHAFRNDGGHFVDITDTAGIHDTDGRGLGVVAAHLDDDDRIDLYVANDGTANFLFLNRGGFRFEEAAHLAGVAGNAEGGYQASMGIACGDLDGDGRPDLLVTNFYGESSTLYRNLGHGLFGDETARSGLGTATRFLLGFGTSFLDYDDDGRLDLMTTNGHVNDNRPYYPYAMPTQLLAGLPGGRLRDVSTAAGEPWSIPRVGRGLAIGDLDNDGHIDALVLAQGSPLAYFHNRTPGGHFLTLRLEGTTSNRDAVGARVAVQAGGRRLTAERLGGGSYQSASDPRLHFGLGTADRVDSVEIRWPSGRVDHHRGLDADAGYLLREGDPASHPLPGYAPRTANADGSARPDGDGASARKAR